MENAEDIVRQAEAIYRAREVEPAVALYEPDAVIVWNGREVARGTEAIRRFHERFFDPSISDMELHKTLRAASGDVIAVEWRASWRNGDGTGGEQTAAEFWTMKGARLAEWRAFVHTRRVP